MSEAEMETEGAELTECEDVTLEAECVSRPDCMWMLDEGESVCDEFEAVNLASAGAEIETIELDFDAEDIPTIGAQGLESRSLKRSKSRTAPQESESTNMLPLVLVAIAGVL